MYTRLLAALLAMVSAGGRCRTRDAVCSCSRVRLAFLTKRVCYQAQDERSKRVPMFFQDPISQTTSPRGCATDWPVVCSVRRKGCAYISGPPAGKTRAKL